MQVLKHLAGMPDPTMKWATAAGPLAPNPPIVRLLGYFSAGQTSKAQELLQVGVGGPRTPREGWRRASGRAAG